MLRWKRRRELCHASEVQLGITVACGILIWAHWALLMGKPETFKFWIFFAWEDTLTHSASLIYIYILIWMYIWCIASLFVCYIHVTFMGGMQASHGLLVQRALHAGWLSLQMLTIFLRQKCAVDFSGRWKCSVRTTPSTRTQTVNFTSVAHVLSCAAVSYILHWCDSIQAEQIIWSSWLYTSFMTLHALYIHPPLQISSSNRR